MSEKMIFRCPGILYVYINHLSSMSKCKEQTVSDFDCRQYVPANCDLVSDCERTAYKSRHSAPRYAGLESLAESVSNIPKKSAKYISCNPTSVCDIGCEKTIYKSKANKPRNSKSHSARNHVNPKEHHIDPASLDRLDTSFSNMELRERGERKGKLSKKIIPECKFGSECDRHGCRYDHSKAEYPKSLIECKYWDDCNRKDCHYLHPKTQKSQVDSKRVQHNHSTIPCKFGDQCNRKDCHFYHDEVPKAQTFGKKVHPDYSTIPCKFGDQCNRKGCHFYHDESPKVQTVNKHVRSNCPIIPCKFGSKCNREECHFYHGQEKIISSEMCRYQDKCTRPNCVYLHVVQ